MLFGTKGPAVLIVEDDPELRALYRTALALEGYAVVAVGDGIDALRHIDADPPDLIVLDIGLPRLSGRDVQREVASHAETREVPIVVVTGNARGLNRDDFACVLQKPIDLDALVQAVEGCLRDAARKRLSFAPPRNDRGGRSAASGMKSPIDAGGVSGLRVAGKPAERHDRST